MKKMKPFIVVFVFVILAMGYSLGQLTYTSVTAEEEAGVCCGSAMDCPGTQICTRPPNSAPCCIIAQHPGCKGESYCKDTFGD